MPSLLFSKPAPHLPGCRVSTAARPPPPDHGELRAGRAGGIPLPWAAALCPSARGFPFLPPALTHTHTHTQVACHRGIMSLRRLPLCRVVSWTHTHTHTHTHTRAACHRGVMSLRRLPLCRVRSWTLGFNVLRWLSLQCRRPGFDSWAGKIPWRREQLPSPGFWPEEFMGYSPWGRLGGSRERGYMFAYG